MNPAFKTSYIERYYFHIMRETDRSNRGAHAASIDSTRRFLWLR